jgi:epsilon-lactone hydrolase
MQVCSVEQMLNNYFGRVDTVDGLREHASIFSDSMPSRFNSTPPNSWAARALKVFIACTASHLLSPRFAVAWQRRVVVAMTALMVRPLGVSRRVWRAKIAGDLSAPLGLQWVPQSASGRGCVLYFHGGGYTVGSPQSHANLTMRIAKTSGRVVYCPKYRLAPEHPYPAQLHDAQRSVDALLQAGMAIEDVILAGDSAGAHLALTLTLQRKAQGQPLPRALVLISPVVDMALDQLPSADSDVGLGKAWLRQMRDGYVAPALWQDPLVSPVLADCSGLPPVLVQSASAEVLALDAKRMVEVLRLAGVAVRWEEDAGLWHDYHLSAGTVPEATRAVASIGEFIRQQLPT